MTWATYSEAMDKGVFPHEGGYTNDPRDPGGPTNYGITIHDARKYWKPNATAEDMRNMPKSVARDIYKPHYADVIRYGDLPDGFDYSALDYAINSGVARSGKVMRRICGLSDKDWHVTDEVINAIAKRDTKTLIAAFNDERLRFLHSLSTWDHFGGGWGRRVVEVRALSMHFADAAAHAMPVITATQPDEVMAKGVVPQNAIVKAAVNNKAVLAGGTGAATGAGLWSFINAHPYEAAAAVAAGAIVIGGALYLIERAHESKQTAATPGLVPVPVK